MQIPPSCPNNVLYGCFLWLISRSKKGSQIIFHYLVSFVPVHLVQSPLPIFSVFTLIFFKIPRWTPYRKSHNLDLPDKVLPSVLSGLQCSKPSAFLCGYIIKLIYG